MVLLRRLCVHYHMFLLGAFDGAWNRLSILGSGSQEISPFYDMGVHDGGFCGHNSGTFLCYEPQLQ